MMIKNIMISENMNEKTLINETTSEMSIYDFNKPIEN